MKHIASPPYVFQSNLVAERFVEHRKKNLGCFKKLGIELNNIGKTAQSFFSKATRGLVANPYSLEKMDARPVPRYAVARTPEDANRYAHAFMEQRHSAFATFRETVYGKAAECKKAAGRAVGASEYTAGEDKFAEYIPRVERHDLMNAQAHYALQRYEDALILKAPMGADDEMEEAFRKQYATAPSVFSPDQRQEESFRETMKYMEAHVSEILIGEASGVEGVTREEIFHQCIQSFGLVRKEVFYQALKEDPALLSGLGPRVSRIAEQYDDDFHAVLKEKLRNDTASPLQDVMLEAHRETKVQPSPGFRYTPASLEKLAGRLNTYTSAPALLSKMAAHAARAIQSRYPRDATNASETASMSSAAGPENPAASDAERKNWAIAEALFPSDELALNEFSTDFSLVLPVVVEKHKTKFQQALGLTKKHSSQDILALLEKPYMKHLLQEFLAFRRKEGEEWHPAEMGLRVAHGLAISTVFPTSELRNRPLAQLNDALKKLRKEAGLGACEQPAAVWVKLHRPDIKLGEYQ